MGARLLSSTGLGSGNLIGRAQFPPVPALDKNWSPTSTKGTPKNLSDKDFAELSGELSGAVCLKTLVLLGSALVPLELVSKFFGGVRAILLLWGSFLALPLAVIRKVFGLAIRIVRFEITAL